MTRVIFFGILLLCLFACTPSEATLPQSEPSQSQKEAALPEVAGTTIHTPSTIPQQTATSALPSPIPTETPGDNQEPVFFPLSELGQLVSGRRSYTFLDPARQDRRVEVFVWYPAVQSEGQAGDVVQDAPPDRTGAPYPVILSSAKVAGLFGPHLVSYGFVVVGVRFLDTYEPWDFNLVDQPLDILFALEQVAAAPLERLDGMLDADRSGVMGYSFDGYNSLALSGARIAPNFYKQQCNNVHTKDPPLSEWRSWYFCDLAARWDEFEDHAGSQLTVSDDGLWKPMTDQRILAVMPMAPEGAWIFGERGLAEVDRPTLIIAATEDKGDHFCPYDLEAVYIFEHLGTPQAGLISFIGQGHMMIMQSEPLARHETLCSRLFRLPSPGEK